MTKTTTTCDHRDYCKECGKDITDPEVHQHRRIRLVEESLEIQLSPIPTFCSHSCLVEYLKPKTETTP